MSNTINTRPTTAAKQVLAERLRQIRLERLGGKNDIELVRLLGVPSLTWSNYENGVTVPGEVLLHFIITTGVEPRWLLKGEGPKFRFITEDPGHNPVIKRSSKHP